MRLREITRLLAAAGTVLLASIPTPALAQAADLGVALALVGETRPSSAGLTLGGSETYEVTVTNNGPTHVTEFTLGATIDPALEVVAVTGCEPLATNAAGVAFPCTVSGTLVAGGEATVEIEVTYPAPDPLSPDTAACPNGTVNVTSSVTISAPRQDAAAVTDPTAGNNSATVADAKLRNWADLEIVSLEGPANVSEGQTVKYTAQVRNNGPCPAPNVVVTLGPSGALSYVEGSVSSSCTNASAAGPVTDTTFDEENACELGALAKGDARTVSADYTVQDFADEVTAAAVPLDVSISSETLTTPTLSLGADDPDEDNNADGTSATIDLSDEGCSTGGAGTLVGGLLALAALRLRRRR